MINWLKNKFTKPVAKPVAPEPPVVKIVVKPISDFRLSQKSLEKLKGVHPDLVAVVKRAICLSGTDFGITEGLRSAERQKQLVANGDSTTQNSRHLTGHAVDVVAYIKGIATWDFKYYTLISYAFQDAADELDIQITWGGSWKTFKDGCHFELNRKYYP